MLAQSVVVVIALRLVPWPAGRDLSGELDGAVWLAALTMHSVWAGRGFYQESAWRVGLKRLAAYAIVVVALGTAAALAATLAS